MLFVLLLYLNSNVSSITGVPNSAFPSATFHTTSGKSMVRFSEHSSILLLKPVEQQLQRDTSRLQSAVPRESIINQNVSLFGSTQSEKRHERRGKRDGLGNRMNGNLRKRLIQ